MAGSTIGLPKARKIAGLWHGGQASGLYSLASWSGITPDNTLLRAAGEVERELAHAGEASFFATPADLVELGQLQRYLAGEIKRRNL